MKGLDWIKVSTNIGVDGDMEHMSDAAFRTYIELLAASSALLSDGRVVQRDARKRCNTRRLSVALDELSRSGHVILDGDFIVLPKYGKWQLTRAEVEYARRVNSQRVALFREPGLQKAIRDRDGDFCRYCGQKVNWHDRRGPSGGTYDHVIPDGGNTLENVVVCCRSCNSSKGGRTPEEWGVELIPIQNVSNYRPSSRPSDDLLKSKSQSKSNPSLSPPISPSFSPLVEKLVGLCRNKVPGWKPNDKDYPTVALGVERLGERGMEDLIMQLATYQAATNKYTALQRTLANWINRENPVAGGSRMDADDELDRMCRLTDELYEAKHAR